MTAADHLIKAYSPNIEWGKQHVEVVLQAWEYRAVEQVSIGGNCRGLSVLISAVADVYERAVGRASDSERAQVVLTNAEGGTLLCEDDMDRGELWIEEMVVSLRIVGYDPPTLNELRARNGAPPVSHGDRLWEAP